jgi:hypothetical protein
MHAIYVGFELRYTSLILKSKRDFVAMHEDEKEDYENFLFFLTKRGGSKEQSTLKYIKQEKTKHIYKMEGTKPKLHYFEHNLK